jgi:hypothetical protein
MGGALHPDASSQGMHELLRRLSRTKARQGLWSNVWTEVHIDMDGKQRPNLLDGDAQLKIMIKRKKN